MNYYKKLFVQPKQTLLTHNCHLREQTQSRSFVVMYYFSFPKFTGGRAQNQNANTQCASVINILGLKLKFHFKV